MRKVKAMEVQNQLSIMEKNLFNFITPLGNFSFDFWNHDGFAEL
jgi:hypothetical protein